VTNEDMFSRLFIFEMANNHMGDLEHGIGIIREFAKVTRNFDFRFAFKFQYRQLDTFIHPQYKGRQDIKYVARFESTRLEEAQQLRLKQEAQQLGFVTVCTAFDEDSVDLVEKHGYDILKIASCSFTDWPLLERAARSPLPIILSTAGAELHDIDSVVAFFSHREKHLALMHCVGEYPTAQAHLELGQIDFLQRRYPETVVGYSTHEEPDNLKAVQIAIGMGASIFERHVGLPTERYALNAYSSTPEQAERWLAAAREAFTMCGARDKRREVTERERADLEGLKRGAFAARDLAEGASIGLADVFFAIPNQPGQLLANDFSKYSDFTARTRIASGQPLLSAEIGYVNTRAKVSVILAQLRPLVKASNIALPLKVDLEISHQYGMEQFERYGASIISCINREYCKKIIIMLPGQENPTHHHKKKEETFHILYGSLFIIIGGKETQYRKGDLAVVERGQPHSFRSDTGAIFEEVSTTHFTDDSFYDDASIMENPNRKTWLTVWSDRLYNPSKKVRGR
jgi:sialic acid synthase SpsE/mannose-6-phosphate isomerase-like protein (cupin superfamily)